MNRSLRLTSILLIALAVPDYRTDPLADLFAVHLVALGGDASGSVTVTVEA